MTATSDDAALFAPLSYENWINHERNVISSDAWEFPLYSDARLTGEVTTGLGPYAFFNPVALRVERGFVRPAVVLRLSNHLEERETNIGKSTSGSYHGGGMPDELAALASLLVGARFRAGAESRHFSAGGDASGRPVAWELRDTPALGINLFGPVLPEVEGDHTLMNLGMLSSLPTLQPDTAIALIRAARLHQDALWIVETEPNLAWIMLVSAIETAANHWRRGTDDPVVKFRGSCPELVEYLESTQVSGLVDRVAREFSDSVGATAKFVDFILEHLPDAPNTRPPEWAQFKWERKNLTKALRILYGHRSKALHEGIPFPAPLCRPVVNSANPSTPAERPALHATSELGGVWYERDLPMYLHTFWHIARGALLNWWHKCAG